MLWKGRIERAIQKREDIVETGLDWTGGIDTVVVNKMIACKEEVSKKKVHDELRVSLKIFLWLPWWRAAGDEPLEFPFPPSQSPH